jgi:uncharacterized protein YhaN
MDATKHEETYMQRQLEKRRELLKNAQDLMQIEEEKSTSYKDYSEDLQMLESEERSIQEAVSKAQWVLEQKQEKDIETDKTISELTQRYEQIQKAKEEIQAIEDAKKNIEDIAMEVRSSFGKKLNERASYYMSKITDGKYDNITIDEQLNISINGKHSLLSTSKLSKGTMEQIYMALRLAATDIIFEKEKMPILLDDAFVMYDNKRMGNTMKFLSRGMEQVVVFSCHTREKVMADKLGIKYNFIRMADE